MSDLPDLPPIERGRYRHYKGLDYEVLGVVRHSETLQPLVLYRPLYNTSGDWVRPYAMFLERVVVDGVEQPRFACMASAVDPAQAVDEGLGHYNAQAAPLHEVQPMVLVEHDQDGRVIAGATGRMWVDCAELQQLWVDEAQRSRGLGRRILQAFERQAAASGARQVFLETFSFQAPEFYARCGYATDWVNPRFPHGIRKHHMSRDLP